MVGTRQKITIAELCRRWPVGRDKVWSWIDAGELRAIDSAAKRGQRGTILIDLKDLKEFERRRAVQPRPDTVRSRRNAGRQEDGVVRYFEE